MKKADKNTQIWIFRMLSGSGNEAREILSNNNFS